MKRTTIYLTDQQVARIQAIVEASGLKFAEVLRRLLDQALAAPPPSDE
jgi:predicted DNA binding CopG/RHH family protein